MVEYTSRIDQIFGAAADPIRRDILERTSDSELTVNQIAIDYDISLAAISKHLKVLFDADLIKRRKDGRYHFISAKPEGMQEAIEYMQQYDITWSNRPDKSQV